MRSQGSWASDGPSTPCPRPQSELMVHWALRFSGESPDPGCFLPQPTPKPETKSNGLLSYVVMVGCLLKKKKEKKRQGEKPNMAGRQFTERPKSGGGKREA